jgi:integrase/recombinase XerD
MAGVKVVLRLNKKKEDGTFPIVIRVTNNRQLTEKFVGHSVKLKDWDNKLRLVKKSHPNSVRLNYLISKKVDEISKMILDADTNDLHLTQKHLKHKIKHNNKSSFNSLADEHLSDLIKLKKFNQHSGEKPRVNHFKNFLDQEDISFQNITVPLLKKYMLYLKTEKSLGDRSVMNCLIVMRTIFNKAISDGLVESKHYPFGQGKIQIKLDETRKIGLNEIEIKKLAEADLEHLPGNYHARNIWMASFYLAGVRISDIIKLKWTDINDGRLTYVMGKNRKIVSLKLPEKAKQIIDSYKEASAASIYVFPYLKEEDGFDAKMINAKTRTANSVINKNLKTIAERLKLSKKLSMHISRHTFGQIAGDKIAPQMLQKLYRHSNLSTTIGYQANFIHKDVDGALDDVLNF